MHASGLMIGVMSGLGTPLPNLSETPERSKLPLLLAVHVTCVIGLATAIAAYSLVLEPYKAHDLFVAAIITIVAIGYDAVVRRIEYIRRLKNAGPYVTMTSVWTFGAAISLPLRWSVLVAIVVVTANELHSRLRGVRRPVYRVVFNISVVVIPCAIAYEIVGTRWQTLGNHGSNLVGTRALLLVGALAAYGITNSAVVAIAISIARKTLSPRDVLGSVGENLLELATLALGSMVALAISVDVWLTLLATPAMLLLQRSALVDQLESDASEDSKTGLLNSAAWEHLAERDLAGSIARKQPVSLLAIDLDNFKRVNDQYGHLGGDEVLKAVATCMKTMLRDRDLISRFGGEEFMALLPGADSKEAMIVAERLRMRVENLRVAQVGTSHQPALIQPALVKDGAGSERSGDVAMRITVSVGVASYPSHGHALAELMEKADAALYQAKHDGRNRVQLSPKLVETETEEPQVTVNETGPDPIR